jgi:hypothetical protein
MKKEIEYQGWKFMDDNIWEYPFGELDEDEEIFFRELCDVQSITTAPFLGRRRLKLKSWFCPGLEVF